MRKAVLVFLLALICLTSLFANNGQKTYLMSDDVWKMVDKICRMNGVLGPTPISPSTEAELLTALSRLDYNKLNNESKELYDRIVAKLDSTKGWAYKDEKLTLDPSISINPQIYLFNNTNNTYGEEFFMQYKDRDQLLSIDLEASIYDNIYLDFHYSFMDTPTTFDLGSDGKQITGDFFHNFSNFATFFNVAMNNDITGLFSGNKGNTVARIFSYQPTKVGGSFGNDYLNLFIGRTRQAFGNGVTGNLIIGDNFTYQEVAKLSVFTNIFSYHLSLTHYDNAEKGESFRFDTKHQNRTIQRLDFNINNKLRFAINIGAHIYSNSMFDWRMIMPMMLVHNWNNNSEKTVLEPGDEINNILGLEAEWVINRKLMLTAQIAIDQFRLPVENESIVPSAFGVLVNAKYITPVKNGIFDSWLELVYTNPYLYLNYKKDGSDNPDYGLDHIAGYYWSQSGKGELNYLGHSFGPDTIAISIGTEFISNSNYDISASLLYKIHGEKGIEYSYWPKQNQSNAVEVENEVSTPSGVAEHTAECTISGSYKLNNNLSFNGSVLNRMQWNYHNIKGETKYSIQTSFGLRWIII